MCQLSFLFAHFQHKEETNIPRWFSFLESQGIAQSWLCGMWSSIVCDFSTYCLCVWVFLNFLKNQKYQPSVDWYTSLNVPVWYPWMDKHQNAVKENPQLSYLQPPLELLQAATTFIIQTPTAILPSALLPAQPQSHGPQSLHSFLNNKQSYQEAHEHSASSNVWADFQATQNAYIAMKPWFQFFQAQDSTQSWKKPPIKKVDVFLLGLEWWRPWATHPH